VVARWQLLLLGVTAREIELRVEIGRLHRLYRGVYSLSPAAPQLRARWMAAVLSYGEGSVLSHRDAGALLDLCTAGTGVIHVTTARSRHDQAGIRVHRVRKLHPDEVTDHEGIPVTTVARTLLDIAETEPYHRFERCFEQAERLNLLDLNQIEATAKRDRGRRGLRPLLSLTAQFRGAPDSRSTLERNFIDFCRAHDIPEPQMNVIVCGFEVDAVWHDEKLIAELDSWSFHRGRRAFENDRERDIKLALDGYVPIRITARRIHNDARKLADEILRLLGRR
jgi:hypothetical protein